MQDMHTSTSGHFHQTDTSWLRSTTPGDACSLPRAAPAPVAPSQMLSLSPLTSTASAWSENRVAPAKNTCHLLIASRGPCAVDLPSAILFFTSLLLWYFCFRSMWPWNGMACSCVPWARKNAWVAWWISRHWYLENNIKCFCLSATVWLFQWSAF